MSLASTLTLDLRYTLRQLCRAPAFALGVILILALGIGANTAMFTVLRATLFRPLAYRQPGQLVSLNTANAGGEPVANFLPDLLAWRGRSRGLADLAYFTTDTLTLNSGKAKMEVIGVAAGASLFQTLGTHPFLGRSFTAEEQQPGREHVVVLSYSVWKAQFGGDPAVLGHMVRLDDQLATVIGVMPGGFAFPADNVGKPQIWQPAPLAPGSLARNGNSLVAYDVIARRDPHTSIEALTRQLSAIQHDLLPLYPSGNVSPDMAPSRVDVTVYRDTFYAKQQKSTLALTAAVSLLWLIACADVAGLSLARATARRREAAVRSALGATRWRLARQLFTEASVLSLCGGTLGLALSCAVLSLFQHRLTQTFGPGLTLRPDGLIVSALLALSLVSALAFGAGPSLLASNSPLGSSSLVSSFLGSALQTDSAQAGIGRAQYRLGRLLVVGELALTLCLLVGCGLLLRTVFALRQVPLGFRTDHIFSITPHLPRYKYKNLDSNLLVYRPLAARLRALPGVQSLAVTSVAPLAGRFDVNFMFYVGDNPNDNKLTHTLQAKLRAAGPELQQVLGFRMLKGRFFDASDTPTSGPAAVVNRAFERTFTPAGGDISRFHLGGGTQRQFKIVGVVDDFHQQGIAEPAVPEIDLNAAQMRPTDPFYQPTLEAHAEILLRSDRDPGSLLPELRHALVETNPDLAGAEIETMDQIVEDAMGSQLLAAHLLETLGGLALLIALASLYSLLAYLITLRTREFGLRLALGAERGQILSLVLRGAGALLLAGSALGLGLSLVAARLLQGFLFGVPPHDPLTLVLAPTLLLAVGLAAAWLPARRAAHLEPLQALQAQ